MVKKLENKVAVVTGAASGMGKAISMLFASEGCKVVAADIAQQGLDNLKKEITDAGGQVTTVISNVTKEEDIENMIKTATSNYGTLDILVNCAGISDNGIPAGDMDNAMWEKVMKLDLDAPFKAIRSAIKNVFLPKKSGVIINISSLAGLKGGLGGPAYTASKHALVGLTKNVGFMYAKAGIRCNAICPGMVETPMTANVDPSQAPKLVQESCFTIFASIPRPGKPIEIAQVALFLASDDSSFVNAAAIPVDAGWAGG